MRLEPRQLRLVRQEGPLLPQIEAALATVEGKPLRWAITSVSPAEITGPEAASWGRELVLEAVFCLADSP
ncbi:hypothetical protein [Cyanobium sp. WAJ14-Wanaka]|uniref:hypothetical protein n=1 Tax=Cyanobium sp. WAJ14-Wanaka TaxID=2823725 RepID=UPI0020CEF4C0|nr:hypothetical protein [Cyanobium sp. WAJ14-Wanaka]MCP9775218.1 hypothetical protein [Cyanobium sp. WAJ14-Wanaka]